MILHAVLGLKESTTYQAIIREGRAEGRAEGRFEGRVEEAQRLLLRLGRKRFGRLDAATRATLDGIADVERLEQLAERVLDVESWAELLATPPPRRRNGRRRSE